MWYKVDFAGIILHLLPPILRSDFLIALMRAMVIPLQFLYNQFYTLKKGAENKLNITGNVQYLEKALNEAFFLHDRQIYIIVPEKKEEENLQTLYFKSEQQLPIHFYMAEEERPVFLVTYAENRNYANIIVMVPSFLCTSTKAREDDIYHWEHIMEIKNILKAYKPAGRTFSIELYDYE